MCKVFHKTINAQALTQGIKREGHALGFQQVGVTNIDLSKHEAYLNKWLENGYAGSMSFMSKHGSKRSHPDELVPNTIRVISARMNYLPKDDQAINTLNQNTKAYIARYALGRDYHKVLRKKLQQLATSISENIPEHQYRVFTDSAPVLEKALAEKSGLGWIGKNTLLIHQDAGSWFFLGEIYTNLPLIEDTPAMNHCGSCTQCIAVCPTEAILDPYTLDARKCIAYLTIENKGPIPIAFRKAMGNRVFGCDDCQIFCPWNKFSTETTENDFAPRHQLESIDLLSLFQWTEAEFLERTLGSPIRRTGYRGWLRNLSVSLGNAPYNEHIVAALALRLNHYKATDEMLSEHFAWAISNQKETALSLKQP